MRKLPHLFIVAITLTLMPPSAAFADVWWHGWKRAGQSAWKNFKRPAVWVPLASSAAFAATNADQYVSDKARENNLIFSDAEDAKDASNQLKDIAMASMFVSTLIPAPTEETGRLKRLSVAGMAAVTTFGTTQIMKNSFDRTRPDGSGDNSFPSNHTAEAANAMMITRRNIHAMSQPLSNGGLILADIGVYTVEGLAGWARVEAGKHYPSDVLFSIAMGNWIAGFFYDWFIDDPETSRLAVNFSPVDDGMVFNMSMAF